MFPKFSKMAPNGEQPHDIISFAEFDIDTSTRRLLRDGQPVAINSKTFDLLAFLAENKGRIVSKDEILDAVWSGQFVEEANLSVQISALRKALGEQKGDPRFLVTIPGRGYKFVADTRKHGPDTLLADPTEVSDRGRDSESRALSPGTQTSRKWVWVLVGAAAIAFFGFLALSYFSKADVTQIRSIAVLPFANQNGSPDTEYLSDGLAESVILSMSRLQDLRVMSRNSAFRYKGSDLDALSIGRELNVDAVLTGRFSMQGDTILINAELIAAADNSVIWGENFQRTISNIGRLQTEIAHAISQKLRLRLSPNAPIEAAPVDPEAFRLYLLGRHHIGKFTDEGFFKGRDHFQQSIERDPNYAAAYAGLAEAYNRLSAFNVVPPAEGYLKARPIAIKALELDDQMAETHAALGTVLHFYDWDWSGAEAEFKRAIEIDPNNADSRMMYAYHLASRHKLDEALAEMRIADKLDPLALEKALGVGDILYYQRNFDAAIEQYRRIVELDPNSGIGRWAMGNALLQKGMYAEAIAEYQRSIPLSGDSPDESATLAYAYAISGKRAEALKIVDELKQRSKNQYIPPSVIAFIYAGLGDKDEAFEWLEKAFISRDFLMSILNEEPLFDRLRDDPRFTNITTRVGLPKTDVRSDGKFRKN